MFPSSALASSTKETLEAVGGDRAPVRFGVTAAGEEANAERGAAAAGAGAGDPKKSYQKDLKLQQQWELDEKQEQQVLEKKSEQQD